MILTQIQAITPRVKLSIVLIKNPDLKNRISTTILVQIEIFVTLMETNLNSNLHYLNKMENLMLEKS